MTGDTPLARPDRALPRRSSTPSLAVLGFDVMRFVLRVVLPLSLAFTAVMVALYTTTDDPRFATAGASSAPPTST